MSESSFKVLYAEDEQKIANLVSRMLTECGCEVTHITTANECIERSENDLFDLIVVDMILEQGHGAQVVEHVRKTQENINHETPFLVISAQINDELLVHLYDKIQGAIVKPFKLETLTKKVLQILNGDYEEGFLTQDKFVVKNKKSKSNEELVNRFKEKAETRSSSLSDFFFFDKKDKK